MKDKYKNFRDFKIVRNCNKKYSTPEQYRPYLKKDFHYRCAYCNTWDVIIEPLSFHIEHYVPEDTFKKERPELKTLYENLMYACPKCNLKKKNRFEGDMHRIENTLFYDPTKVDYNNIFYRDKYGTICSEDKKGCSMITLLDLSRRVYNVSWMLEQMRCTIDKMKEKLKENISEEKKKMLQESLDKIVMEYYERQIIFAITYKNKKTTS